MEMNDPKVESRGNLSSTEDSILGLSMTNGKVVCMMSMLVVTLFSCYLPIRLLRRAQTSGSSNTKQRWGVAISLSSCFSGGVFVAACMLDLLPEVEEVVSDLARKIKDAGGPDATNYPLAQLFVVVGFFLILFVEQMAFYIQERWKTGKGISEERLAIIEEGDEISSYQSLPVQQGHFDHHHHGSPTSPSSDDHDESTHDHGAIFQQSSLRAVLLLLALSFHSVFEGLALGLQETSRKFNSIFIAVILHKAVIAFSLGMNIAQSEFSDVANTVIVLVFSLASPLGVITGICMFGLTKNLAQVAVSSVLQGFAGGTFLYITFFEVLPHELNVAKNRLWKCFFVFLGFLSICIILHFSP